MYLSAKAIGKDQKIGEPNCAIAIQIEPRVNSVTEGSLQIMPKVAERLQPRAILLLANGPPRL